MAPGRTMQAADAVSTAATPAAFRARSMAVPPSRAVDTSRPMR